MASLDQERAALRRAGIVPITFQRSQLLCAGPDEPACIQALCVDCGSFSTAPSLTTLMQPPARFIVGSGWQCVEFHEATVELQGETRESATRGGAVASSEHTLGVSQ